MSTTPADAEPADLAATDLAAAERAAARVDRAVVVYRLLLHLYPRAFRDRFEPELLRVFGIHRHQWTASTIAFWRSIVWDVARSAPALRLGEARAVFGSPTFSEGPTMLAVAMAAMLTGGFEILNALGEWWTGGVVGHDGGSFVGGAFGAVAGAMLVAAGIALVRSTPSAMRFARGAAITALLTFGVLAVVHPVLSVFARLIGVVIPAAVLAVTLRAARPPVVAH